MNKYLNSLIILFLIGFPAYTHAGQIGYPKDPTQKKEKKDKKKNTKKKGKTEEALQIDSINLDQPIINADSLQISDPDNVHNNVFSDSLENEINRLKQENIKLKEEIENLTAENKRKENRLKELEIFESQYLARLATSFDSDWSAKPYAEMNLDDLNELVEMCAKYSSQDKQIREAQGKFSDLQKQLAAYITSVQLNDGVYDLPKINQALIVLAEVTGNATPMHKNELQSVTKSLKNYRIDVSLIKEMIGKIDEAAAEFSNHEASMNGVREILEEYNSSLEDVQYHPWLAQKYKEYLKEVNKNCKEQGPARNAIMDLKTN